MTLEISRAYDKYLLSQARHAYGITQREAAVLFGVPLGTYKSWEAPANPRYPKRRGNDETARVFIEASQGLKAVAVVERAAEHFREHGRYDEYMAVVRKAVKHHV
jgi:hypothetical protein